MAKNILFISPQLIKERSNISDNIDDKQIVHAIKISQDMYLEPVLGTTFYQGLQTRIDTGLQTNDEDTLIKDFIHDMLINQTLAELAVSNSMKFWNKGLLQKTSDNSLVPSLPDLQAVAEYYRNRAEWYSQRLINYLRENENTYPEYRDWRSGLDVIRPKTNGYTGAIYLGDDSDCGCEAKGEFSKYYQGDNFTK
jgi:hypothetical protein